MAILSCLWCGHKEDVHDAYIGRECLCTHCRRPTQIGPGQRLTIIREFRRSFLRCVRENQAIVWWILGAVLLVTIGIFEGENRRSEEASVLRRPPSELERSKRLLRQEFPGASETELDDAAEAISDFLRATGK